ncbi:MAG: TonB-dependent receptor [Prevotella sp.]|nr:TonB-dependent receptor [Prevotella sp.]
MKKSLILFLMAFFAVTSYAQNRLITGNLSDRDTKEPLTQTTVQLLRAKDSTFVAGTISNNDGNFSVKANDDGRYIVRITSIGYKTVIKHFNITNSSNVDLGKVVLGSNAVMLKGATIVGQAAKVTLKEDTFIYNSAAYRTPEGSTIEELVKRLPGAQISDDGKITINGKEVKKILVEGKEFMTGDTKTALKNIPTSVISKIKAYDKKSDLAKVTGIDDGEEETVLDFGMKAGMNKGMFSNVDLSAGTKDRYSSRAMGAYFNDKNRLMIFANANNTNDQGFPGGGGFGRFGAGQQGLNASKMLGLNYNFEQKDKLQVDASVRWQHADGDVNTTSSVENFVSSKGAFSNSINQNFSRSDSWNARMRLEWNPDSMTDIMFRPSFTYSNNDGVSKSTSGSYNADPYSYVLDPLSKESITALSDQDLMVNTRDNSSISNTNNKNIGASLQYNRKFGNRGRNLTLKGEVNYGKSDSKSLSLSNVHLYQIMNSSNADSTYQTNRWNVTPTTNSGYDLQFTYSEPIMRATFLQFSYKFQYKYSKSDRSTYDFSNLGENFFSGLPLTYGGWNSYLSKLANPVESYIDNDLSRYSEYKNYIHDFELMLRIIRTKYTFNVGVMVEPQKSSYMQDYKGVHVDTTRTVTNVTPTLDFRYRFSKVSNLRINYRGTTSQPSMTQLLDITDDSDPLNISKGNPGLKPSFTNNFRLFYNNYIEKKQRAIMTFINYSNTSNDISSMVTYNEATGGRVTRPENINGNWNVRGAFMFNTAIDSAGVFNVNTFTNVNYNNYVAFTFLNNESTKTTTRSSSLGERIETSYRNGWLELAADGSLNYTHSRNDILNNNNLDTWQFAYGGSVNITLPWGTSLATDLHNNSRRGYSDNAMNTNELVWNAQLSQGLLKGNALTVSLQLYDILHNQSNFSRTISAIQRSDTQYNSINSYAMLHVIYRVNIFGGKDSRMNGNGPDGDGPGKGERRGGMPRGGMGGGGRPF